MTNQEKSTQFDTSSLIEHRTGQLSPRALSRYILQSLYGDSEMGKSLDGLSVPTRQEIRVKTALFDEQANIVFENPLLKNFQPGEKLQKLIISLASISDPNGTWLAENVLALCAISIFYGESGAKFSPSDQLTLLAFAANIEMTKIINILSRDSISGKRDITSEYFDHSQSLNYFNFCRHIINIITMGAMDTSWRSLTETIDQEK